MDVAQSIIDCAGPVNPYNALSPRWRLIFSCLLASIAAATKSAGQSVITLRAITNRAERQTNPDGLLLIFGQLIVPLSLRQFHYQQQIQTLRHWRWGGATQNIDLPS